MASIGRAARLSGVAVETIRYYERVGVVPAPQRSASRRRVYDAGGIARLQMIKRCRDLGFPLAGARALLALSEGNGAACGTVLAIAEAHLAEVRHKIGELIRLEASLTELIRDCAEDTGECPALNALAETPLRPSAPSASRPRPGRSPR